MYIERAYILFGVLFKCYQIWTSGCAHNCVGIENKNTSFIILIKIYYFKKHIAGKRNMSVCFNFIVI